MRKVFPVFAIVWGAVWIIMAFRYGMWVRRGPGGGFYPLIGGILTVLFAGLYLKDEIKNPLPSGFSKRFIYPIAAVLAVLLSSYILGLLPCMLAFIFLWLWRYEKFSIRFSAAVAVGTITGIYLIFVYWLSVPLPTGWVGQMLDVWRYGA